MVYQILRVFLVFSPASLSDVARLLSQYNYILIYYIKHVFVLLYNFLWILASVYNYMYTNMICRINTKNFYNLNYNFKRMDLKLFNLLLRVVNHVVGQTEYHIKFVSWSLTS